jgi:hypothetical protein
VNIRGSVAAGRVFQGQVCPRGQWSQVFQERSVPMIPYIPLHRDHDDVVLRFSPTSCRFVVCFDSHYRTQACEHGTGERSAEGFAGRSISCKCLMNVNGSPLSQRPLQCAPAVESFTRSRKQDFARTFYNHPGLPSLTFNEQHLFSSNHYADLLDSVDGPTQTPAMMDELPSDCAHDDRRKHMECMPVSETHIQNNTCVLAPEVTEGPYYHIEGHPVRRNIAEYQDGLLLVCFLVFLSPLSCNGTKFF